MTCGFLPLLQDHTNRPHGVVDAAPIAARAPALRRHRQRRVDRGARGKRGEGVQVATQTPSLAPSDWARGANRGTR